MDWQNAFDRLMEHRSTYVDLIGTPGVNVNFALSQIDVILKRYNSGERTKKLYDEMMSME
jgi:hypothetical protein